MIYTALVGCAHIHVPGFIKRLQARSATVKVKWVWDPDPARARKRAAELGTQTVSSVQAVWDDREVGCVIICTETGQHQDLVSAAVRAGKHLFVEKPLGLGASDARAMARSIRKMGLTFQTGYFMRSNPVHRFLKQQIRLGHMGHVHRLRMSNCHAGALEDWFTPEWTWMTDPAAAGFGGFGDLGSHAVDLVMWLMEEPVDSVTATVSRPLGKYGEDCDETGEGLLVFRGGAVANLSAGWVDLANPVTLVVSGTEGHAHVREGQLFYKSAHVPGADGKTPWTDLPEALPHAFDLFFEALDGGDTKLLVDVEEAAVRSLVIEKLYAAARSGRWERVGT